MSPPATVVVGRHWGRRGSELAYVIRCVAGAATRCGPVVVLAPGPADRREPDGAFDLEGMGEGEGEGLCLPELVDTDATVFVDELTAPVADLLARSAPRAVYFLTDLGSVARPEWNRLHLHGGAEPSVEIYVPVNPLAQLHRHHGFGFTGYLLVLSDRSGPHEDPPPAAAWLSAAFNDADVVVVEDAVASAWRGRALRGSTSVDTRTDLWRLMAHAGVCVDLAPGPHIARECVEALRFGTPVVVPRGAPAGGAHARGGGGAEFGDERELIDAVGALTEETVRAAASARGRSYAEAHYGDPAAAVRQLDALLRGPRAVRPADPVLH